VKTRFISLCLCVCASSVSAAEPVSYHRQIRPILQQKCQGCHQPARKKGGLLLTRYDGLAAGGDNGPSFTAGKEDSRLLRHLRGEADFARMPEGEPPLSPEQIELFAAWIRQGARDDTPAEFKRTLAADGPPTYFRPVPVTAMAYSGDGSTLAVAGYREVLLHRADGVGTSAGLPMLAATTVGLARAPLPGLACIAAADNTRPGRGLVGRLVGLSERIESLVFSPNGDVLLVAGGSAGRFGELQFWDWKKQTLRRSVLPSYDTVYGASFAPDGKRVAFGCADNSARVIDADTGKQLVRIDHHLDWVFGTALSPDGKRVITASRDRSVKMCEADTGTLLGTVTTLDPTQQGGSLRGLVRRPNMDQYLVAGEDGAPQLYNGGVVYNGNLLRTYPARRKGRIEALAFSSDGAMLAAGGVGGLVRVYGTDNAAVVADVTVPGAVFALAFRPGGKQIAVAGLDGVVRVFELPSGKLLREFVPVPLP
jgi:WD40 repeat protein/mono/diheme cytochrome c family protein